MNRSPYIVRKVVRFGHCDPAGIIYYPQYFMLAHDCKEDWFRHGVGYPLRRMISIDRRGFPIVKLDAEFTRASRLGEDLDFELVVRAIGATSLKLDYRCVCGTEERMRIKTVLVMTDLDAGTPVPIPDWLRAKLEEFQESGSVGAAKDAPAKDAQATDAQAKDAQAKDAPAKDAQATDAQAIDAHTKDAS